MEFIYGLAISLIILLLVYVNKPDIEGFWVGDPDFCEESGCTSMLLYIGDRKGLDRTCMLVITDDIASDVFKMRLGIDRSLSPWKTKQHADVTFEDEQHWPKNIVITTNLATNTMAICDTKTKKILAILNR
jgi:hypothetical protein